MSAAPAIDALPAIPEDDLPYMRVLRRLGWGAHYSGVITRALSRLVNGESVLALPIDGLRADQHQQNGTYGAHQLRLILPGGAGDVTVYRVIVAPANAPVSIGGVPAAQHFSEPLIAESAPSEEAGR